VPGAWSVLVLGALVGTDQARSAGHKAPARGASATPASAASMPM